MSEEIYDPIIQRIEESMPIEVELDLEHSVDSENKRTGQSRVLIQLTSEKLLEDKETQLLAAGLLISAMVERLKHEIDEKYPEEDNFPVCQELVMNSVNTLVDFLFTQTADMKKTCH